MSSTTTTKYCFRCQYPPDPDDGPLKRCSGCRSRHYCSKDCQSNDWPQHKKERRILAAGGTVPQRTRTTMRRNGDAFGFGSQRAEPDPNVIYYLKYSKPGADVAIFGPMYPLGVVETTLRYLLKNNNSSAGLQQLDEIVNGPGLLGVEHFTAPMPDGNIMKFELLREENAKVARVLSTKPGDLWNIVIATPDSTNSDGGESTMFDYELEGTFTSLEEATAAAGQELEVQTRDEGQGAFSRKLTHRGMWTGTVETEDEGLVKMVFINHKMGRIMFGDGREVSAALCENSTRAEEYLRS